MANEAKILLMNGLTERLHARFVATHDGLNQFRDFETFKREMWEPGSDLHKTLARAGMLSAASKTFVETLPQATTLTPVATALEKLTQDDAPVVPTI